MQDRLNNIAILHVYHERTDKLDLEKLLNQFISKNATFCIAQVSINCKFQVSISSNYIFRMYLVKVIAN